MNLVKDNKKQIIKFFNNLPFNKMMGISLVSMGEGLAEMTVDYNWNLIGDKKTMVIHGGVVTTLLDAACGGGSDVSRCTESAYGNYRLTN